MARLVVRANSHRIVRTDEFLERHHVPWQESEQHSNPANQHISFNDVARSRFASYAPGFEDCGRSRLSEVDMDDKRRARVMAVGPWIEVTEGEESFAFPAPLVDQLAVDAQLERPKMSQARAETPDTIGIALGSPSHISQFLSPATVDLQVPQQTTTAPDRGSSTLTPAQMTNFRPSSLGQANIRYSASRDILAPTALPTMSIRSGSLRGEHMSYEQVQKPKISRWRSLGGLFAKKPRPKEPSQLKHQVSRPTQPFESRHDLRQHGNWNQAVQSPAAKDEASLRPVLRASPRGDAHCGLGRSQTLPIGERRYVAPDSPDQATRNHLGVDIPSVKMDRYSVMFNGILQHQNQQGGLLARRQSRRIHSASASGAAPIAAQNLTISCPPTETNTAAPVTPSRLLVFPPNHVRSSPRTPKLPRTPKNYPSPNSLPPSYNTTIRNHASPAPLRNPPPPPISEERTAFTRTSSPSSTTTSVTSSPDPAASTAPTSLLSSQDQDPDRKASLEQSSPPPSPHTPSSTTSPLPPPKSGLRQRKREDSVASWDPNEPTFEMITIGKLAEPGDRFSGARCVRVVDDNTLQDLSPVREEETAPRSASGSAVGTPWHPLRMNTPSSPAPHPALSPSLHRSSSTTTATTTTTTNATATSPSSSSSLQRASSAAAAHHRYAYPSASPPRPLFHPPRPSHSPSPHSNLGIPLTQTGIAQIQIARSMSLTRAQRVLGPDANSAALSRPQAMRTQSGARVMLSGEAVGARMVRVVEVMPWRGDGAGGGKMGEVENENDAEGMGRGNGNRDDTEKLKDEGTASVGREAWRGHKIVRSQAGLIEMASS